MQGRAEAPAACYRTQKSRSTHAQLRVHTFCGVGSETCFRLCIWHLHACSRTMQLQLFHGLLWLPRLTALTPRGAPDLSSEKSCAPRLKLCNAESWPSGTSSSDLVPFAPGCCARKSSKLLLRGRRLQPVVLVCKVIRRFSDSVGRAEHLGEGQQVAYPKTRASSVARQQFAPGPQRIVESSECD